MLAAHSDQENRIHSQQLAAAAKPQNHGVKGLGAKTPGNKLTKTPFKVNLNDENAAIFGGKVNGGKANGGNAKQNVQQKKNDEDGNKNAYLTPAGQPRRAPLGLKTTNAKALQTPAAFTRNDRPDKTLQKTASPRLRRAKVKIHQAEAVPEIVQEEAEPEIEYCPLPEQPLPDYPSDLDDELHWGPDKKFPMLEGKNANYGLTHSFLNPIMDNGETYLEQKERERAAKAEADLEAMENKIMEEHWKEAEANLRKELGPEVFDNAPILSPSKARGSNAANAASADREPKKRLPTGQHLSSRAAATALAAPTRSSAARQVDPQKISRGLAQPHRQPVVRGPQPPRQKPAAQIAPKQSKHATAVSAARSTLGYSKGRATISKLHRDAQEDGPAAPAPQSNITRLPSALESLGLGDEDEDLFGTYVPTEEAEEEDDDDENVFQFTLGA